MINRSHVDDVLEIGEATLDLREFLVAAHRVDRGQIGFFGLDDARAEAVSANRRPLRERSARKPSSTQGAATPVNSREGQPRPPRSGGALALRLADRSSDA
jgi:hypothetical protein